MKINTRTRTITLGRNERAAWSTRSAGTPEMYEARRAPVARAQQLANETGRPWEVYAPAEAGGYCMEQVTPRG